MSGGGSFFANRTGNAAAKAYQGQYNFNRLGLGDMSKYTQGALSRDPAVPGTEEGLPQNQTSAPQTDQLQPPLSAAMALAPR